MKNVLLIALLMVATTVVAQPNKRRTPNTPAPRSQQQQQQQQQAQQQSARQFPAAVQPSDDVVWRRDIYRTLDLTQDANAPLYYPVEPTGKQMNLFTYVFRLMLTGRIHAYQYNLDGNENFDPKNRVDVKELLERHHIYYEEKDGHVTVAPQDMPGAEVTRYYIKESASFDQRTSTFQRTVSAICPVLMRGADEFSSDATPYPLFWLNYAEVATYLQRLPIMASNYNNTMNMTAADYFSMNLYDGKIYKTNNMQGRALSNYCRDDSTLAREQKRIEAELEAFEQHIWTTQKPDTAKVDSVKTEPVKPKARQKSDTSSTRRREAPESRKKKSSSTDSGAAAAPARASVRRERR